MNHDIYDNATQHQLAQLHAFTRMIGDNHVLTRNEFEEIARWIITWCWPAEDAYREYLRIKKYKEYGRSKNKKYYWVTVCSVNGPYKKVVYMCPEQVEELYPGKYEEI